jgi:hypothetical protein
MFDNVTPAARGRTVVVTPEYENARIHLSMAQERKPGVFGNRPFMPITTARGYTGDIAFHWDANPRLLRGFMSNGCIRLRDKDVYELYGLLRTQRRRFMSVRVSLHSAATAAQHPYPLLNNMYRQVTNFGTKDEPRHQRALTEDSQRAYRVAELVRAPVPQLSYLSAVQADHWTDTEREEYSEPNLRQEDHFEQIHGVPDPSLPRRRLPWPEDAEAV